MVGDLIVLVIGGPMLVICLGWVIYIYGLIAWTILSMVFGVVTLPLRLGYGIARDLIDRRDRSA